ncbi:unnamed protein product [Paramecium primaurelia]|uniref:Protein kinase domain-containing protein n=1 Tax=Paramecium primaurelia TaxID=5886 RepID=A0A8S1QK38_PARPR|nr:unnamed protein product [Paramecium primaurelia]
MLQQYNSIVVDASYINKNYTQESVIGRGRDFYLGISSICYLMSHAKDGQKYILQIYENLGYDIFRTKVLQLQKAMLECVNEYNTRIVMIAEKEINDKQSDLYVLYRLNALKKRLDQEEQLNQEQALELLITFCKNLLITGRSTFEFLDLAPQNIFVDGKNFVISNMGISYKGSKFHRPYTPSTDNFYKDKSLANLIYTYSFQAGLVVLCAITKINSADFFFEDGQLKDNILQSVLKVLRENQKTDRSKEDQLKFDKFKDQLKKQINSLSKIEKPFEGDYKMILPILSQILSLDQQKRSIFQLLICYPDNPLKVEYPFFQQAIDVDQQYVGFGKLDEDNKIIPHGYGYGKFEDQWHYGIFENGELSKDGTIEMKTQKAVSYILLNLFENHSKIIVELNKYIYIGEFDQQKYIPNGKGEIIYVLTYQKNLPRKRQVINFEGDLKLGEKIEGREFYRNKSFFDGQFAKNSPREGIFTYGPNHFYDGIIEDFKRVSGKLYFGELTFEGEFENNKAKDGVLLYEDGSEYKGLFQNGQRSSLEGKYTYSNQKVQYIGNFREDTFHGKGVLILLETNEQVEVEYEYGRCKTDLPDNFKDALKKNKKQVIQKMEQKKPDSKQKKNDDDDEQIKEEIDEGFADDDGQYGHDLDDEDA